MSRPRKFLKIQIDGAARGNPGPAGIGVILTERNGRLLKEMAFSLGEATNNVAETIALIVALQEALKMDRREVTVFTDSELLARQVVGDYRVKDKKLQWLHVLIRHLTEGLKRFEIQHVPREQNRRADRLAAKAVAEALKNSLQPKRKSSFPPSNLNQPTFW